MDRLTPREQEIVRFIAADFTNKQIARLLWLSEKTVKAHVCAIVKKLDVRSRTGAAVMYTEHLLGGDDAEVRT